MPVRPGGPITQDWNPVVIQKRGTKPSESRDPKVVNAALRSGAEVEAIKKFAGGSNKKSTTTLNTRKLDEETEALAHEKVSTELKHAIQKARLEKKLTQAQLAQQINERPQVVQEYESGKAIPNQQIISKMERVLGVKLRAKHK